MSRGNSSLLDAGATSILLLLMIFSMLVSGVIAEALLGVCYGELGTYLPQVNTTIRLLKEPHVDTMRLYDANPQVLAGLKGTGLAIGVIISVQDSELKDFAQNPSSAGEYSWVKTHVSAVYPVTRITNRARGNEILSLNTVDDCGPYLLPAMCNIYNALYNHGLQDDIKVVAPLSGDILGSSWPPSASVFVLQFLQYTTNLKFFTNVYPYDAYEMNPVQVPLDYAVPEFVDSISDLPSYNLFDAMMDATHSAMINMGVTKLNVSVAVGETGWPTAGGYDASAKNAESYNRNLIRHTPYRPKGSLRVPVFLFSLYNEDQKIDPETEKNWGMLYPNATAVSDVVFNSVSSNL